MILTRKLRVAVLAIICVSMVFFLYSKRNSVSSAAVETPNTKQATIMESGNNDKQDAAINKEISKEKEKANAQSVEKTDQKETGEEVEDNFDPAEEFKTIRTLAPMTVFSKSYCPFSLRLKKLLADHYVITPPPTFVELDKHENGQALQKYLKETTKRGTVPNVIIGASHESKGGCDDFVKLHDEGNLEKMLNTWGDKAMTAKRIELPLNI